MNSKYFLPIAMLAITFLSQSMVKAQTHSVGVFQRGAGAQSILIPPLDRGDIFNAPLIANTDPMVFLTDGNTAIINVDAFSFGRDYRFDVFDIGAFRRAFGTLHFSVDRNTIGRAPVIVAESSLFEAHTDVFSSSIGLGVTQSFDGNNDLGLLETPSLSATGLDGFDSRSVLLNETDPPKLIYFSVRTGDAGRRGASIFVNDATNRFAASPSVYASFVDLGLTRRDDIDAIEVIDNGIPKMLDANDIILFSLTPNSPSLPTGMTGGHVFIFRPNVGISVFLTPRSLGLRRNDNDNVDAISLSSDD